VTAQREVSDLFTEAFAPSERVVSFADCARIGIRTSGCNSDELLAYFWGFAEDVVGGWSPEVSFAAVATDVGDVLEPHLSGPDAHAEHFRFMTQARSERILDFDLGERVRSKDGFLIVRSVATGSYFVTAGRRVVAFQPDLALLVKDCRRVLKQAVIASAEGRQMSVFHASGVAFGDAGLMFVGDRGAGKSTCLLASLGAGARLASNDRVILSSQDGQATMHGWPDPVRVVVPGGGRGKRSMSLRDLLGGDAGRLASRATRLHAVALVELCGDSTSSRESRRSKGIAVRELAGDDLVRRLKAHCLTPVDHERPKWLELDVPRPADLDPLHAVAADSAVRGYVATGHWSDAAQLVEALRRLAV
jgi:hypothetical protein